MPTPLRISVVLPVRNGEDRIGERVARVMQAIRSFSDVRCEVVVVDDGSRDGTIEALEAMRPEHPELRIVRHSRPRGMEAAGQTGLERSTGELVFIQETDSDLRIEDLKRLWRMSADPSVVAARAESAPRPISGALLRRLRAWGTQAREPHAKPEPTAAASLQMIRRPHLQKLASPQGRGYRLEAETWYSTAAEPLFSGGRTNPEASTPRSSLPG